MSDTNGGQVWIDGGGTFTDGVVHATALPLLAFNTALLWWVLA